MLNDRVVEFNSFRGFESELPPAEDANYQTPKNPYKFLMALDFSDKGFHAWQYAERLAEDFQAEMDVLHVFRPEETVAASHSGKSSFQNYSTGIEAFMSSRQPSAVSGIHRPGRHLLELSGDPTEGIIEASMEKSYQLVIMGWDPNAGHFEDYLRGHVTGAMIQFSNVPLLMVPYGLEYRRTEQYILPIDDLKVQTNLVSSVRKVQSLFKEKLKVHLNNSELTKNLGLFSDSAAHVDMHVCYVNPERDQESDCTNLLKNVRSSTVLVIKAEFFSVNELISFDSNWLSRVPILFLNESRFTKRSIS